MPKPAPSLNLELELRTVLSHELFPGRGALTVGEVADAWQCTIKHVLELIEETQLIAFDIRGRVQGEARPSDFATTGGNKTARRCLRVPVSAYDAFLLRRSTTNQ